MGYSKKIVTSDMILTREEIENPNSEINKKFVKKVRRVTLKFIAKINRDSLRLRILGHL